MRHRWQPRAWDQFMKARAAQPSEAAARRFERLIEQAVAQIEMFPESAPRHKKASLGRDDVRALLVGGYRMAYMIEEENDELEIFSLLPAHMDSAFD